MTDGGDAALAEVMLDSGGTTGRRTRSGVGWMRLAEEALGLVACAEFQKDN